jgi:hypothetical protein
MQELNHAPWQENYSEIIDVRSPTEYQEDVRFVSS